MQNLVEFKLQGCSCNNTFDCNFDGVLQETWISKQHLLNYSMKDVLLKETKGSFNFIAENNVYRHTRRRKAYAFSHIYEGLLPNQFNFNKASEEEIMLALSINCCSCHNNGGKSSNSFVLVNLSPFADYSCLLVPSMKSENCQFPTIEGLKLAVLCALASSDLRFKVGFNSLCGHASVNHEHYHLYYSNLSYVQKACLQEVYPSIKVFQDYPGLGFVLTVDNIDQCDEVIKKAMVLIYFMKESNLAFNIGIVKSVYSEIRLCIWARTAFEGSKMDHSFLIACAEFSGHFILTDQLIYDTITEELIIDRMTALTKMPYKLIYDNLEHLFKDHK